MRPERERGEMLYENMSNWRPAVRKPAQKDTTDISSTWWIYMVWTQPSNKVYYNLDLGYGRSHPTKIKQIDSGMVAAIQSVSHVQKDNNPQSQPGLQQTQSRVLCSISTQQSTSSSMRICELKLNMQEHRLITSQWWKLLTNARGTTNNDNGPQGTTGTIYGFWINELASNTRRITRSEANDENLTSKCDEPAIESCRLQGTIKESLDKLFG